MRKDLLSKTLVMGIVVLFVCVSFTGSSYSLSMSKYQMFTYDGNTLYVGGNGSGNYTTIQGAIDDASDGDTVFVYNDSSPYYESITINISINLIGEDKNTTIIEETLELWRDGIAIYSDFVNVSGFTVQNFRYSTDAGVHLYKSNNCNIYDNIFRNNSWGIRIDASHYNILSKNMIYNQQADGIYLEHSSNYNSVFENNIYNNGHSGINNIGDNNNISYNIVAENSYGGIEDVLGADNIFFGNIIKNHTGGGLMFWDSNRNLVSNNYLLNNEYGIVLYTSYGYIELCVNFTITGNIISDCKYDGITLEGIGHKVFNNNVTGSKTGIDIYTVDSYIFGNNLIRNDIGFSMDRQEVPTNNHIYENNILYNKIGVFLRPGFLHEGLKNNYFYKNNFIRNILSNAHLTTMVGDNYWDYDGYGNYWDDYTGIDDDGDGIGDSPYVIKQSQFGDNIDHYPLMEPYGDVPEVTINVVNKANNFNILSRFLERFPLLQKLLLLIK